MTWGVIITNIFSSLRTTHLPRNLIKNICKIHLGIPTDLTTFAESQQLFLSSDWCYQFETGWSVAMQFFKLEFPSHFSSIMLMVQTKLHSLTLIYVTHNHHQIHKDKHLIANLIPLVQGFKWPFQLTRIDTRTYEYWWEIERNLSYLWLT